MKVSIIGGGGLVEADDSGGCVSRLMSSVSFGYGLFHLAVSLLPPKLLSALTMIRSGDGMTRPFERFQ